MPPFLVSTYFQALPFQQQLMARFELAGYLSVNGEQELAKAVCNAATPEGLAPHLSAVDKVMKIEGPDAVFRSSRMFSPAGELVHGPVQQVERPIEERQTMLASLGSEIRIRNPKGTDSEGAALAEAIEKILNGDDAVKNNRPRIEAYIVESQGYLAGLAGDGLDDETLQGLLRRSEDAADAAIYGARLFIDAVRGKYISASGGFASELIWLSDAFTDGALDVWDRRVSNGKIPRFVETVSRYWAKAHGASYTDAMRNYSREMGSGFGKFMLPRMEMALAASLPREVLNKYLHLLDVEIFIYARGWLRGHADRRADSNAWVGTLRNNLSSVISVSIRKRDVGYIAETVISLPSMLSSIDAEVARLMAAGETEAAEVVLANRRGIISRAIFNGVLEEYVKKALRAVPSMLSSIDDEVVRLKAAGKSEAAAAIIANRGSIISRAIHNGLLEGCVEKALEAVPAMLSLIDDEVARLRDEGKTEAAKAIIANRGSILSLAIGRGTLEEYVIKVIRDMPEMLSTIDDGVARLKVAGESEAAEAVFANRRSILVYAVRSGWRKRYIVKVLNAVPGMLSAIDDGVARLEAAGASEVSEVILSHRKGILLRALESGGSNKYVKQVFKTMPDMLSAIDDGIEMLEKEGKPEAGEAIRANRGSVIYRAVSNGMLEKYVGKALSAIPGMLSVIDEEVEKLKSEGEQEVSETILAYRGSIIARALNNGALERYVAKALNAVTAMRSVIDDEVARLEGQGESEASEAIRANRGTILGVAFNQSGLEVYVRRALDAVPGMLLAIDDGIKRLEGEGKPEAAEAILKYRRSIINHALHDGALERYVHKALESALDMPWLNGDDA